MSREENAKETEVQESPAVATPKAMSRRALLRCAVVGAPAALTLHSRAALARSSNLVGVAPPGTRDEQGNALCLDPRSVQAREDAYKVDLGEPANATVNVLRDRVYWGRHQSYGLPAPNNADMVCQRGGTYYYRDEGWHRIDMPANGVIVSATAMVSVSLRGDVLFNRIA